MKTSSPNDGKQQKLEPPLPLKPEPAKKEDSTKMLKFRLFTKDWRLTRRKPNSPCTDSTCRDKRWPSSIWATQPTEMWHTNG